MITCYFENGDKVGLRHVTVAVIVVKDGKILLCKRGTYNGKPMLESGKWAFPGGFLDRDENLVKAVERETKEETGFDISNIKLFHIVDKPDRPHEDRQNVNMVFVADFNGGDIVANEETGEIKWFDLENLPSDENIAFDFAADLELYRSYLKESFSLPIFR